MNWYLIWIPWQRSDPARKVRFGIKTGHGFFQDVSFLRPCPKVLLRVKKTGDLEITLELLDSGFLFGQGRFAFAGECGAAFGIVLFLLAYPAVQCA